MHSMYSDKLGYLDSKGLSLLVASPCCNPSFWAAEPIPHAGAGSSMATFLASQSQATRRPTQT